MPWRIVYIEKYDNKKDARKRERQIKKWKNRERINTLISRDPYTSVEQSRVFGTDYRASPLLFKTPI